MSSRFRRLIFRKMGSFLMMELSNQMHSQKKIWGTSSTSRLVRPRWTCLILSKKSGWFPSLETLMKDFSSRSKRCTLLQSTAPSSFPRKQVSSSCHPSQKITRSLSLSTATEKKQSGPSSTSCGGLLKSSLRTNTKIWTSSPCRSRIKLKLELQRINWQTRY